jgi:hypothetical protein
MSESDQAAPSLQVPFVGHCDDCERVVRSTQPLQSSFEQAHEIRVACRECGSPALCDKDEGGPV